MSCGLWLIVETNIHSIHAGPFKKGACVHIYLEIVEAITRCHHYWHLKQSLLWAWIILHHGERFKKYRVLAIGRHLQCWFWVGVGFSTLYLT
jgi:hypothetical protein